MRGQQKDEKHTDKFGYASIQVGDSAALFSKHFEKYGIHYGQAAKNIGNSFSENGSAHEALKAGERFFSLATGGLPVVGVCALASSAATALQAAASVRNADQLVQASESHFAVREADYLLQVTKPESLIAVLDTAVLYGKEVDAGQIYVVVADSYHTAQLRLTQETNPGKKSYDRIQIVETIQDAFQAASTRRDKVLIYFHTLKSIALPQGLEIENCKDIILRSDAGQSGLQPRLVLTGKIRVSLSKITFQSVAFCGGVSSDEESQVTLKRCTDGTKGAANFLNSQGKSHHLQSLNWRAMALSAVAIVASAALFPFRRSKSR